MSTLKVNNLQDVNGANNSTPEQVAQGRAKAWVNVTGGANVSAGSNLTINNSFNVDSVTDNGEGKYTVTFTNAMANANYCPVFGFSRSDSNMIVYVDDNSDVPEMTTSACKFRTTNSWSSGGTLDEVGKLYLAFFGD